MLPPALSPPTMQTRGIDAELFRMVGGPFGRGDAVLDGGGKAVLGREPVIDGEHQQLAFMGELAADHVMGLEIADHPAAAMEEDEAGRKAVLLAQRLRRVEPRRDRAVRRGDCDILCRFKFAAARDC